VFLRSLRMFVFLAVLLTPGLVLSAPHLQRFVMTTFVLQADRQRLRVGDHLHLTVRVVVRGHLRHLDRLVWPVLTKFSLEGRESHRLPGRESTAYVETLTLRADRAGWEFLEPATIDAINAANDVPSRFASNPLQIRVDSPSTDAARTALPWVIGWAVLLAVVFAFVIWRRVLEWGAARLRGRLRRAVPSVAPTPPAVAVVPEGQHEPAVEHIRTALEMLRRSPDHETAQLLRLRWREAFAASSDETLADLVARLPDGERGIFARALRAAERIAFVADDSRMTAIDESLMLFDTALARLAGY